MKAVDDNLIKKSDIVGFASHEVLATQKISTLIQKIEALNAKARASDGKHDVSYVSNRPEQRNKLGAVNTKVIHSTKDCRIISPASLEDDVSTRHNKGLETAVISETAMPRKSIHGVQGRVDHRGKGRFNMREGDGWHMLLLSIVSFMRRGATNVLQCEKRNPALWGTMKVSLREDSKRYF